MPTLLQLNATANWGSTGKIAEAIGLAAQRRGWQCYTAYGRHANPSALELIRVGEPLTPYFHYLQSRVFDGEGLGSGAATSRLVWLIDKLSPDVVQLHNIHDHWLNYRILFEYLNSAPQIKVVWTFHDCWAFTGHCFHFAQIGCGKWKTECGHCPLSEVYPKSMIDRSRRNYRLKKELFASYDNLNVVACSEWMADLVRDSFLGDKSVGVIYNGVDINVFAPGQYARSDGSCSILAVSNVWNAEKGLSDIVELRRILPSDYAITVVGLSPDQIHGLPPGITGLGRLSADSLVSLYNAADVFVNTTYADTFPTVNLEALACGTPVVTYATGGSPEAVDEKTGIVVPCGDVQAMADAIVRLKEVPLSRSDCRHRAMERFDKDRCFDKYIDLYESLIGHTILPSGEFQEQ